MKADTICVAAEKKVDAVDEPQTPRQLLAYLRKVGALYKPAQAKLEALELPDEKRSTAERAISLSAKGQTLIDRVIKELLAGKDPRATLAKFDAEAGRLARSENKAWRSIGAKKCAD